MLIEASLCIWYWGHISSRFLVILKHSFRIARKFWRNVSLVLHREQIFSILNYSTTHYYASIVEDFNLLRTSLWMYYWGYISHENVRKFWIVCFGIFLENLEIIFSCCTSYRSMNTIHYHNNWFTSWRYKSVICFTVDVILIDLQECYIIFLKWLIVWYKLVNTSLTNNSMLS